MTQGAEPSPVWFLDFDLDRLDEEIDRVRGHIREVKLQGQESTEQSSESWHDNYNFEESQRQLKMFLNHLGGLSKARERAVVVEPPESPSVVGVGVTVTFKDHKSGLVDTFHIGSYTVSNELRDLDFISYESPVAQALHGLAVGDQRSANVGGSERLYEVLALASATSILATAREQHSQRAGALRCNDDFPSVTDSP